MQKNHSIVLFDMQLLIHGIHFNGGFGPRCFIWIKSFIHVVLYERNYLSMSSFVCGFNYHYVSHVCVCACACVCECEYACERACVRPCVCHEKCSFVNSLSDCLIFHGLDYRYQNSGRLLLVKFIVTHLNEASAQYISLCSV